MKSVITSFTRTKRHGSSAGPALTPKAPAESEADAFAAALLMPDYLIRPHFEKHGHDVDTIREIFGCSHKAMSYRLDAMQQRDSDR
jgi:Zn-dependent peptidase ImmA (M78 family)